jgi:hypothetical protein
MGTGPRRKREPEPEPERERERAEARGRRPRARVGRAEAPLELLPARAGVAGGSQSATTPTLAPPGRDHYPLRIPGAECPTDAASVDPLNDWAAFADTSKERPRRLVRPENPTSALPKL